jgi:hypothetical protein
MVMGSESNGGCSRYSAHLWGSGTSVTVQGGVVHPLTSLAMIGGGIQI